MNQRGMQEFKEELENFHRTYLTRTTIFLAVVAWIIFVGLWHRGVSLTAFGLLVCFQAFCMLVYKVGHRWPAVAQHGLVLGYGLWVLGVTWFLREPLALFPMILAGQIAGALLPPRFAFGYIGLLTVGALQCAYWLFPSNMFTPQLGLPPILTIVAVSLSSIWANNLSTALAWAYCSTRDALNRLAEVQEHRGQLYRMKKDLEEACYRLERATHMLALARAEAEEARECRNRFVLMISHELRTPLNFIIGFSELMVNSPATYAPLNRWPPGLYADVQEIYRSSTHLLRLVNDVLELGQIEAQRVVLIKEWVNPAEVAGEVEAMVRSAFARKGLWFRIESVPELPKVFVDRTRIRQVLLNLATNSLRFTERGGVTVRLQKQEKEVLICVQDTGPGIAEEEIPLIFEEFRQVGNGSWRRREGFGMGLSISRRFVELHGGHMWLESQVGRGACFYLTLPFSQTTHELAVPLEKETTDARYWRYLKEKAERERTLLALSPDPAAGEVIARYVEGYRVIALNDPDQVRSRVASLLPHALIVDRAIMEAKAIQSIKRDLPYDLPVISFAFPGSPIHFRGLPTSVQDYLVKPIQRNALAKSIRALGPHIRCLLVVDDDPAMVRFVTLTLQSERLGECPRLTTAFSGCEALAKLCRERPDAILLDLSLPDMNGWEVLEKLRSDSTLNRTPVILMTAYDWPQMVTSEGEEVLQVMMHRPLTRHELTAVLENLLGTIRPVYPTAPTAPVRPTSFSG